MCGIVAGLISTFTDLGVQQLFIREPDSSPQACNTAWTMGLLQSILIALLIVLCTPLAAHYFQEPRIRDVFYILALSSVIGGFSNVGIMLARKQLIFDIEFRLVAVTRISNFIVTVALAFALEDYRAIVFGALFAACIGTLYSYQLHPYRPKIDLKDAKHYLRFGLSIIPQRIGAFLYKRLDIFIIGGTGNTSTLGLYNVAQQLPEMASFEIATPIARGLYPSYSTLTDKPTALVHAFLQGLTVTMAIILPITGGLWSLSYEFIHVVFGTKWAGAVWFLEWLTIYAALESVSFFMTHQILIVTGHERRAAFFMWIKLAIFLPLLFVGFKLSGVEGVAIARSIGAGLAVFISILILVKSIPVTTMQIFMCLWRPIASTVLMVAALEYFANLVSIDIMLIKLIAFVCIGAVIYCLSLLVLWVCAGRPGGLENFVIKLLRQKLPLFRSSN